MLLVRGFPELTTLPGELPAEGCVWGWPVAEQLRPVLCPACPQTSAVEVPELGGCTTRLVTLGRDFSRETSFPSQRPSQVLLPFLGLVIEPRF